MNTMGTGIKVEECQLGIALQKHGANHDQLHRLKKATRPLMHQSMQDFAVVRDPAKRFTLVLTAERILGLCLTGASPIASSRLNRCCFAT